MGGRARGPGSGGRKEEREREGGREEAWGWACGRRRRADGDSRDVVEC
jgi:hypothetical protein